MADPTDTGNKTISGRTIWNDPETGEDYSERSTTFEIDGKYYTMPTVAKNGGQYTSDVIRDYVKENGPIDYITGEKLPEFRNKDDAIEYAISRSSTRKQKDFKGMAKGGVPMDNQMRRFAIGGLSDDGMDRDPVSGNEIPPGSLAKEVRDDIPAQLSEGEYVVPADVVKFFGVRMFEEMRNEAKMGLQAMEDGGRIGGDPIKPEASLPEPDMPEGLSDPGLSPEDLANLESMMAGKTNIDGSAKMNEGGLLDKVEYMAKNDPLVNQLLNEGGIVVGFAGGGMAKSISGDPKEVDAILNKFMALTKENPSMMDELATRGIKVNRTTADQQPREMQARNSPVQTTNPVTNTQQPVDAMSPPPVAPQPIKAALGTFLPGSEGFALSQTKTPYQFGTLGGSNIYSGATGTPGNRFSGAAVNPCPPGQVFDPVKKMCVVAPAGVAGPAAPAAPVQNNNNDDNNSTNMPEPKDYSGFVEKYGTTDWSDPDAYTNWAKDFGAPLTDAEKEGVGFGVLKTVTGVLSTAGQEVDKYSQLQVAKIIAQGRGDEKALAAIQGSMDKFLAGSGKFVGATKNWLPDSAGYVKAMYGDAARLAKLDLGNIGSDKWTENDQAAFKKITGGGRKSSTPVIKASNKIVPPMTAKARKVLTDASDVGKQTYRKAKKVKKDKDLSGKAADKDRQTRQTAENVKTASSNLDKKITTGVNKGKSVRDVTKSTFKATTNKDGKTTYTGGFNAGGLMKRNRIK